MINFSNFLLDFSPLKIFLGPLDVGGRGDARVEAGP